MSVMWNDWSNSTAAMRHASCSSRQLVYCARNGISNAPTGELRSISTALPTRWSLVSRLSWDTADLLGDMADAGDTALPLERRVDLVEREQVQLLDPELARGE